MAQPLTTTTISNAPPTATDSAALLTSPRTTFKSSACRMITTTVALRSSPKMSRPKISRVYVHSYPSFIGWNMLIDMTCIEIRQLFGQASARRQALDLLVGLRSQSSCLVCQKSGLSALSPSQFNGDDRVRFLSYLLSIILLTLTNRYVYAVGWDVTDGALFEVLGKKLLSWTQRWVTNKNLSPGIMEEKIDPTKMTKIEWTSVWVRLLRSKHVYLFSN